ncbi:DUF2786 domain-containing protein [Stenotrophomonas acidaminiphila]|uniref:DUF2786 domain-containing protein n=1 Tax=Stenotrophomonas acidaminiphila TaxID=128780 RepID=UPI0028AA98DF|nr:DUF2786 domain-containing protein [Stenotrophomonas acidaminiphila]
MTRDQAIRKIQACLRLAGSSNPTEAATALRQARALMDKYGLTEADAAASDIKADEAPTGYRGGMIPQSLIALANLVADGYRCKVVIMQRSRLVPRGLWFRPASETVITFYGAGADATVAAYAFAVLRRQLRRDKAAHTKRIRKKANRERRGEVFAQGFVSALGHLFPCAELPEGREAALDAAILHVHGELETTAGKEIKKGRANESDHWAGWRAGRGAQLNQGLAEGHRKLEVIP